MEAGTGWKGLRPVTIEDQDSRLEVRELGSLELNCRMDPWVLSEPQSLHVFWMGVAKMRDPEGEEAWQGQACQ